MAARIAWLLNLGAELELAEPALQHTAPIDAARLRELLTGVADLITPDDVLLHELTPGELPADTSIQAFCPTPSALAQIAALGFTPPAAPSLAVLRAVNDRAFCAELGHGMPGAAFVRDMHALERHLSQPSPTGRHVIKRAFSFAGREQRRVQDGVLDASTRGFCQRSFAHGQGLQVEPWVERLADFCRHGHLTQAGVLRVGPTREQHCDAMGRFTGMSGTPAQSTPAEDRALRAELSKTSAALADAGYFGPFGIDAFRYQDPAADGVAFNPRCEINARFTMGYPRQLLLDALI